MVQPQHWLLMGCDRHTTAPCRSGYHVPPLEGEGLPAYVGAAVHLPQKFVVGGDVIHEGAAEAQGLQQGAHMCLQAAHLLNLGPKWLGDAQVLAEHNHVHLQQGSGGPQLRLVSTYYAPPCSKLTEPSQQPYEVGL